MIKGLAIFAAGYGVGCIRTMSQQEAVREMAREVKNFVHDLAVQEEVARRKAADAEAGVVLPDHPLYEFAKRARAAGAEQFRVTQLGTDESVLIEVTDVLGEFDETNQQGESS